MDGQWSGASKPCAAPPLQHGSTVRHTTSLTTRLHCPTYNLPYNMTPLSDIQQFVQFVLRYAEKNAILLPGRIPGYKCDDIQFLPSSTTKHNIWELYHRTALESEGARAVCYSLFCRLWQQLTPQVVVTNIEQYRRVTAS